MSEIWRYPAESNPEWARSIALTRRVLASCNKSRANSHYIYSLAAGCSQVQLFSKLTLAQSLSTCQLLRLLY